MLSLFPSMYKHGMRVPDVNTLITLRRMLKIEICGYEPPIVILSGRWNSVLQGPVPTASDRILFFRKSIT